MDLGAVASMVLAIDGALGDSYFVLRLSGVWVNDTYMEIPSYFQCVPVKAQPAGGHSRLDNCQLHVTAAGMQVFKRAASEDSLSNSRRLPEIKKQLQVTI